MGTEKTKNRFIQESCSSELEAFCRNSKLICSCVKAFNSWDFVLLEFKIFSEALGGAFWKGVRGDVQYSVFSCAQVGM